MSKFDMLSANFGGNYYKSIVSNREKSVKIPIPSPVLEDKLILRAGSRLKFSGVNSEKAQELSNYIGTYQADKVESFFAAISSKKERQEYANSTVNLTQGSMSRVFYFLPYALLELDQAMKKNNKENEKEAFRIINILRDQGADLSKVDPNYGGNILNFILESQLCKGKEMFLNNLPEMVDWTLENAEPSQRRGMIFFKYNNRSDVSNNKYGKNALIESMFGQQDSAYDCATILVNLDVVKKFVKYEKAEMENRIKSLYDGHFKKIENRIKSSGNNSNRIITNPDSLSYRAYPVEMIVQTLEDDALLNKCGLQDLKSELMGKYLERLDSLGANPNLSTYGLPPSVIAADKGDLDTVRKLNGFEIPLTPETIKGTIEVLEEKRNACHTKAEKKPFNKLIDELQSKNKSKNKSGSGVGTSQEEKTSVSKNTRKKKSKKSKKKVLAQNLSWLTQLIANLKKVPLAILSKEQVLQEQRKSSVASNWWKNTKSFMQIENKRLSELLRTPLTMKFLTDRKQENKFEENNLNSETQERQNPTKTSDNQHLSWVTQLIANLKKGPLAILSKEQVLQEQRKSSLSTAVSTNLEQVGNLFNKNISNQEHAKKSDERKLNSEIEETPSQPIVPNKELINQKVNDNKTLASG